MTHPAKLRPTLNDYKGSKHPPSRETSLYMIAEAVEERTKLIHGHLARNGEFCAIGAFFETFDSPLNSTLIDEVAAFNDSMPKANNVERRRRVLKWLRFKIEQLRPK